MVLYEDLRIYTIWRTEAAQYRQQQLSYKKNPEEWEILGDLAERLHHPDEAIEAWQACLSMRFSPKAMRGVLGLYEKHGDHRGTLGALIRLVAWQYRWYSEVRDPAAHLFCEQRLTIFSSRRTCCTQFANSSRKRARSRFAALSKLRACRSTFWISLTNMRHCVLRSRATERRVSCLHGDYALTIAASLPEL